MTKVQLQLEDLEEQEQNQLHIMTVMMRKFHQKFVSIRYKEGCLLPRRPVVPSHAELRPNNQPGDASQLIINYCNKHVSLVEASLAEADPDVEVKPKRGRKKSATPKTPAKKGRTSRRTSKAKVEAIVEETVPEVETIPEVETKEDEPSETGSEEKQEVQTEEEVQPEQKEIQEEPNEAHEDLPDKENGTQEKSEVESKQKEDPETPHEDEASNPNPKLDSVEKDQIENKKTEDKPEETDQLPDFEEDEIEEQKQQDEPFEIINKGEFLFF